VKVMARYGMTLSAIVLIVAGAAALPRPPGTLTWAYLAAAGAWLVLEVLIASRQRFEGVVPRTPWILASRILWLPAAAFAALDGGFALVPPAVPAALKAAAVILVFAGIVLRALAWLSLGRSFTYDLRVSPGQALVTTGLYRFVRHPSYLALCLLGSVPGLALGSLAGFLLMTLFTVPQILLRVAAEEAMLGRQYGEAFRRYRGKSWKLLPFVY
jgi:protein-S-isoprenylcysteine O-methyltransferase Ste14